MTNLTTWRRDRDANPILAPFTRMRSDMDRLFERFLGFPAWSMSEMPFEGGWMPAVDVRDRDNEITVAVELPGLKPDDIDISVSGNMLHISGKREEDVEDTRGDYYIHERRFGSFARSIELPPDAEPDRIRAEYRDGELIVHVPKSEQRKPKRIPVETSGRTSTEVKPSTTEVKPMSGSGARPTERATAESGRR